jgi:diguanylate cyclase (GGDEF)-like protein
MFGHSVGDQHLQLFAKLLTKCFRSTDVVARLGGDEFVVLMTGNKKSAAALERLQESTDSANATIQGNISWSAGRVEFNPDRHQTLESMLAEADTRMYEDKVKRRRSTP